jgi:hypothetical protein
VAKYQKKRISSVRPMVNRMSGSLKKTRASMAKWVGNGNQRENERRSFRLPSLLFWKRKRWRVCRIQGSCPRRLSP